jgi:hypothetical protein
VDLKVVAPVVMLGEVQIQVEAVDIKEETSKQEDVVRPSVPLQVRGLVPQIVAMKPEVIPVGIMAMRTLGNSVMATLMDRIIVQGLRLELKEQQAVVAVDSVAVVEVIGMTPTIMMPLLMQAQIKIRMHRVVHRRLLIPPLDLDGELLMPLDGAPVLNPLIMRPTIIGLILLVRLNDARAARPYLSSQTEDWILPFQRPVIYLMHLIMITIV